MDRKGGGPMKWNEFYGTNAEKFFYHPVDPNTSYYTATALRQMGKAEDDKPGSDIPARQSLPVHQRPPQWDYIYHANRTASESAMADAALLSTEVQQLEQRRGQLEQEQAVLWCKLAFRAVQRLDVHRKELLQCQLIAAGDGTGQVEQARALAAAAQFLSSALLIVEKAEEDQSVAMGSAKSVVVEARERFEDQLREQTTLKQESRNKENSLGQFAALAKLLGDKSKTLSEAYQGAVDGAANNETARKDSYRGMLQRTVIDYAQILLALNELCDGMQKEWGVSVDTRNKLEGVEIAWISPQSSDRADVGPLASAKEPMASPQGIKSAQKRGAIKWRNHFYKISEEFMGWHEAKAKCEEMGGHLIVIETPEEDAFFRELASRSGIRFEKLDGIWIGATDEAQEGRWLWVDGSQMKYTNWHEHQPNNKQGLEHYAMLWCAAGKWVDQPTNSQQHKTYFACEWDR